MDNKKIMTKERLLSYRSNKAEIEELAYILENRWKSEAMIGSDVIIDYSKGYPMPQVVVGFDQKKYEKLQDRDVRRKEDLKKECEEIENFIYNIQNSITRRIFRMCFIDGSRTPKQNDIAKIVHMDQSNVSKKINKYLKDA